MSLLLKNANYTISQKELLTNINITKILNSGTDANDFLVLCSVNSYGN